MSAPTIDIDGAVAAEGKARLSRVRAHLQSTLVGQATARQLRDPAKRKAEVLRLRAEHHAFRAAVLSGKELEPDAQPATTAAAALPDPAPAVRTAATPIPAVRDPLAKTQAEVDAMTPSAKATFFAAGGRMVNQL